MKSESKLTAKDGVTHITGNCNKKAPVKREGGGAAVVSIVLPGLAFAQGHLAPSGANFLLISLNSDARLRLCNRNYISPIQCCQL